MYYIHSSHRYYIRKKNKSIQYHNILFHIIIFFYFIPKLINGNHSIFKQINDKIWSEFYSDLQNQYITVI